MQFLCHFFVQISMIARILKNCFRIFETARILTIVFLRYVQNDLAVKVSKIIPCQPCKIISSIYGPIMEFSSCPNPSHETKGKLQQGGFKLLSEYYFVSSFLIIFLVCLLLMPSYAMSLKMDWPFCRNLNESNVNLLQYSTIRVMFCFKFSGVVRLFFFLIAQEYFGTAMKILAIIFLRSYAKWVAILQEFKWIKIWTIYYILVMFCPSYVQGIWMSWLRVVLGDSLVRLYSLQIWCFKSLLHRLLKNASLKSQNNCTSVKNLSGAWSGIMLFCVWSHLQ